MKAKTRLVRYISQLPSTRLVYCDSIPIVLGYEEDGPASR